MPLALAKDIIDLLAELGVRQINISGGEPTYHQDLFSIIEYIAQKNIKTGLVTNGYRLYDKDFIKEINRSALSRISFSLKGCNKEQYIQTTGIDVYDHIVKAIHNLNNLPSIQSSFQITLTKDNIEYLDDYIALSTIGGKRPISLMPCTTIFDENNQADSQYMIDFKYLVNILVSKFNSICDAVDKNILILHSIPECLWPKKFLTFLKSNNMLAPGCAIYSRITLYWDTDGSIFLCNRLNNFPVGKYNKDFKTKKEFEKFWFSKKLKTTCRKLCAYPVKQCTTCDDFKTCVGGCPVNWFALDPATIIKKEEIL